MISTYNEFRDNIKNVKSSRKHKVTNSLGVYDAYKYIRKNKWFDIGKPLKEKEFYLLIRTMNKELADALSKGIDIKLPHSLGSLEIRKRPSRIEIIDGKVVNNLPVDWEATLKLWYEDEESYKQKTLVKIESEEVFKVYYNKSKADFTNKSFYLFQTNRELKQKIKHNAKDNKLEAFLISDYYD